MDTMKIMGLTKRVYVSTEGYILLDGYDSIMGMMEHMEYDSVKMGMMKMDMHSQWA